jgi:hypothetical protein
MLFVAHNSEHYGYLEMDGRPIPDELLFRRCGCASVEEHRNLLAELAAAGVPGHTSEGVTYSRRMVRLSRQYHRKRSEVRGQIQRKKRRRWLRH